MTDTRKLQAKRTRLWLQQKRRCCYCKKPVARKDATLEHVVPKSRGGSNRWRNLKMACTDCNRSKGIENRQQMNAEQAKCQD